MNTEKIKGMLKKNEQVLWAGKPIKNEWLDKDVKAANIKRIVIGMTVALVLAVAYTIYCVKREIGVMWGVDLVLILMGVLLVSDTVTCWMKLKDAVYAVTDRRVLVWLADDSNFALPLDQVDEMRIITGDNGLDSLCIGSPACKTPKSKLRTAGVRCVSVDLENDTTVHYPVFYNLEDAKKVQEIIRDARQKKASV